MMWAPSATQDLGRLMANYLQSAATAMEDAILELLVPYDPLPGCNTCDSIQDLWWHPLMGAKWAAVISNIAFTKQPTRCITLGKDGPVHAWKCFMVATVSARRPKLAPCLMTWREPLFKVESGSAIIIDMPVSSLMEVRRAVSSVQVVASIKWEEPKRSPSSCQDQPRIRMVGFLLDPNLVQLDARLTCRMLRNTLKMQKTIIASTGIFADPASMVMECTSSLAIHKVFHLCDEAAFVTDKKLCIRTSVSPDVWEQQLDDIMRTDPDCSISVIK